MNAGLLADLDFATAQLDARRASAGQRRLLAALRRCGKAPCSPGVVGVRVVRGVPTLVCCPA